MRAYDYCCCSMLIACLDRTMRPTLARSTADGNADQIVSMSSHSIVVFVRGRSFPSVIFHAAVDRAPQGLRVYPAASSASTRARATRRSSRGARHNLCCCKFHSGDLSVLRQWEIRSSRSLLIFCGLHRPGPQSNEDRNLGRVPC